MTIFPEDPRFYVSQEYEIRHKRNPAYSWRSFARDLKMSPSMLSEFIKGRYGLSRAKALNVAQTIRLDEVHTEHFIDLLEAGFHRLPPQRELAKLRASERLAQSATSISKETLSMLMDWTYFAMLEIVGLEKGGATPIERWTQPFRRFACDALTALQRLKELRLVKEENGGLKPAEEITITGEQMDESLTCRLHAQVLDLAKLSLEELPPEQRESISVFGSIRSEDFEDMRKELNDSFLKVLNKYASRPGADSVHCFAVQAFPVYKKN
jgi:uncharacterized protein (TIGR02147 family)